MTSQIESIRSAQYTPLYKNEQSESKISQWRLLNTKSIIQSPFILRGLQSRDSGSNFWVPEISWVPSRFSYINLTLFTKILVI